LAVIAAGIWSSILALSGTFDQLTSYVVFAGWIFYALGAAAVFRYRQLHPHTHRPYRVPGYPWTPILFILSALALVLNTIFAKPADAAVGLGPFSWASPRMPSGEREVEAEY
jgi:APA family basic amino acid/polyamine antiporter